MRNILFDSKLSNFAKKKLDRGVKLVKQLFLLQCCCILYRVVFHKRRDKCVASLLYHEVSAEHFD